MPQKIIKDSTLAEILKRKDGKGILTKYEVPCLTCPMARFEMESLKLKDICDVYKINLSKLLKELNE